MSRRLLRAVRLDASDERVFPRAAAEGEWLVTGTPLLAGRDPAGLDAKERRAFQSGFLAVDSFGWATFAQGSRIAPEERAALVLRLAGRLVERAGAPGLDAARAAAEELLADSEQLARDLEPGLLLAIERALDPATGAVRECVRRIERRERGLHARVFAIVPDDEAEGGPG